MDGRESIRQRVAQRVRFFLGEWFLNQAVGTPYYRSVFIRPLSPGLALSAVAHAIRSVEGVARVSNVEGEVDDATRTLQFRAVVHTTEDGTLDVAQDVNLGAT